MTYAPHLIFALIVCTLARAAGPSLVYSDSDIPALHQKAQSEKFRDGWKAYLEQADKSCDPSSKEYANPERADQDLDQYDVSIRGHMSGRRLTKYMQNLGLAYHLTSEKKYRDHGIRLLLAYAKTITLQHPYMVNGHVTGGKGDFMRGLAMGYDQFGEFLTPDEKKTVLEAGKSYLDEYLAAFENPKTGWVPYHNYMGVCGGAAGCVALQLAELDPKMSKDYVARVVNRLKLWFCQGFDKQGAYFEGMEYMTYGLDDATIFADALKRSGGENLFENPTMKRLLDFLVMITLPGEKVSDARNDSDYVQPGYVSLKYAKEYKDGRGVWIYAPREDLGPFFFPLIWDSDVPAVSPEKFGTPLGKYFEGLGLSVWRTGWQKNDVMFSVECGRYRGVTHNQADKGQITLYGHGYRWICDAGYACNREPEGRCQTIAHNCILVDGQGQSISGAGLGNSGRTLVFENNDVFGYALTDSTEAYRENLDRTGTADEPYKANFHMKMDHALRHCIFLRPSHGAPAYAIVLDDISQDGKEHEYTWQTLSWTNLDVQVTGKDAAMVTPKPEAEKETGPGKMYIFVDAASASGLTAGFYDPHDRPPFPRLQAVCKAANPYFASVLIPTNGSVAAPDVEFEQTAEVTTIRIGWPERMDTIVWKKDSRTRPEITVAPVKREAKR